jgi:hypothetical protein
MSVFHRIHWEDWHLILAAIALILIFSIFIVVVIRIMRTPNSKLDHLSKLPFEDEKPAHEKRTDRH